VGGMRLRWSTHLKCGNRTRNRAGEPECRSAGQKRPPLIGVDLLGGFNEELERDRDWIDWVALKDEVGTMSDIGERVKKIVVEHLGVEPDKVTDNASFIDDLGADSLDTVELVMAFEEEFGCEIPDDAAETILTVGDAVKFLEKNAKS
jgi:acyl carrier protein